MASDQVRVRFDGELRSRLEDYCHERDIDMSKTVRRAVDRYLIEQGFTGERGDRTTLEEGANRAASAAVGGAGTVGLLALAESWALALWISPLLLLAALFLLVVRAEPGLSRRLGWVDR